MDKELTPFQNKALAILENRRFWMIIGAAVLIILGAGVAKYFMEENAKDRERLAAEKLYEVEKLEDEGVATNNGLFSPEFVKARTEWTPEKKGQMQKLLTGIISEFPDSTSAQAARLRLASIQVQDAKFDDALKTYEETIAKGTSKITDVPVLTAKLGKGYTFESMEKNAEALGIYDDLTKNNENPLMAEALLSKARVLKSLARDKEVEPVLKKLETDFPGTFYEEAARAMKTTLTL